MPDRKIPPPYTRPDHFELLKPEKVALPNGSQVYFIQGGEQDVLKVELVFKAGRWYENMPGISYFASQLLTKGTATRSSRQIAQQLEALGIHIEINPGFDFVSLALHGLTKHITGALDILRDICTHPSYPANELNQAKNIFLQNLKINREKTSYLASTLFRQNLFGEKHPYGNEVAESDIEKIQPDTLAAFQESYFKDYTCFVTGKLNGQLKNQVTEMLNALPFAEIQGRKLTRQPATQSFAYLKKKGAVQTSLRMGKPVISRTHPDYPGLLLANHVFGGYFGSRLMRNIREEKGLTYGIYSAIHPLKNETYFVVSTDVNKENADLAITEIKSELKKLRSETMGNNELELAKNHFLGSLQTEISNPFAHTEKIKTIELNRLPAEYYQHLFTAVKEVSVNQIKQLINQHLHESIWLTIKAG